MPRKNQIQVLSIGQELRKEITGPMMRACLEIHDCFIPRKNKPFDVMWEDLYFSISALVREARIKELKQLVADQKAIGR